MIASRTGAAGLVSAAVLMGRAAAHVALWDPAAYGWTDDPNQNDLVTPLYDLPLDQWWFHGQINNPPADGQMMQLPAGGTYHGQVACNKAFTSYGNDPSETDAEYACTGTGALHTTDAYGAANPTNVMGCGLAIAYESDVTAIKPEDFAVVSIAYECPWKKDVDFDIPADLPACPEGGCHCMWGWVHSQLSGSEQIYFVGYRCNVTGATNTTPLPAAKTANKCDYPSNTANCTVGPKQPHYWLQQSGNNNFQDYYDPPFYNGAYGFMNGAQTDLYAGASTTTTNSSSASSAPSAASSSSSASIAVSSASSSSSISASTSTTPAVAAAVTSSSSSSSSLATTSTSASAATSSFASTCKRRKRAFDRLDASPEARAKHEARKARRAAKKRAIATARAEPQVQQVNKRRYATKQEEWREERKRAGRAGQLGAPTGR